MSDAGRILVVDDDEAQLKLLHTVLEAEGWKVLPCLSGRQALELLDAGEEVDVIISDLMMPEMDGRALLAAAQERRPEVPFILMTAYATVDSAVEALHAGAFHYLAKPTKLPELRIVVQRARETTETQRELAQRMHAYFDRVADPRWDLWKGGTSKTGLMMPKLFDHPGPTRP